jgi:hypothetical protein
MAMLAHVAVIFCMGAWSQEQHIQVDREKSSFEAFYTQQTIPPSPAEPPSVYDRGESAADHAGPTTIVIPLDDGQPMNSQQMAAATPVAPSASQVRCTDVVGSCAYK